MGLKTVVKASPKKESGVSPFLNYIDGKWTPSHSKKTFVKRNPADRDDVIGEFPDSGKEDVEAAVEAARKAYPAWRGTPAPRRAEILFRVGQKLIERKEALAREMTREMGKVLREARGDVQEAIDTAFYHAGEGRRLFGFTTQSELPNKTAIVYRAPVGVCGLITPWNFPLAIPSWKLFPALVAGNTVVFKPASDTPLSAHLLVKIFEECGLPGGVLNLVHGNGSAVGTPIVKHPAVRVVSFTGSLEAGRQIYATAAGMMKRVSCELGGKNAQIVMPDANMDLAVEGAIWGAFGTTGQRCTATSRIIVHRDIHREFVLRFRERAQRIRVGNGLDPETEMGPLINGARVESVQKYVEIGKKEGADLILGGRPLNRGPHAKGFFFEPTIFDGVKPRMTIAREEIFGPVASILSVGSFDEAIEVLNGTDFGLSSSLYTRDVNLVFRYIDRTEHGVVYVNAPTIGAEAHLPFGGWKNTGNGHREGSHQIYDLFTEWKTVFVDYSGTLQKAQMDLPSEKKG